MFWLLACSGAPDIATYRASLESGRCDEVRDPQLRDDCWLAHLDPAVEGYCARMTTEKLASECAFALAERTHDASWCASAGGFTDDCRLHLLSASFDGLGAADEETIPGRITAVGLTAEDPRAWSAWYRWRLGATLPLDLAPCATLPDALRQEACRHSGVALYHDRLSNARDRGTYPCDDGPIPAFLAYAPDPDLDRARRNRRPDLCRR